MEDLSRKRRFCDDCRSPLWQADNTGPRRYPLADYVKHRMRGFFDLFVGDEVHEFKARGSAQGIAAGVLAESCGRSLTLSGTLMGGYASTLFHLLYRFSPEIRTEFKHNEEGRWINRYGFTEETVYKDGDDPSVEDGRNSRRRRYRRVVRERPGLAPSALFHLIGNSIFLRLSDVASGLPPYEERVLLSGMDSEPDHTGLSQRSAYDMVYGALKKALGEALATGSKRLLGTYLQTLLAYPDGCTRGETVFDPQTGMPIVGVAPLSEERIYPKEQALLDLVAAERLEGRRVLVYATHTGTRDITERMEGMLTRHGFRVAVMKADAVAPDRREAWVAEQVEKGLDVLICHPRLVQTGLDLIDFPTICWYETDYSVYTMRQASRRSWRIGQTRPVRVVFMAYRNSLQADALKLVAKKLQSSLAVEGELPEDGLAAYGDDGDDLMLALARKIVNGDEDEAETVESVFAQARDAEATAEELLVDDGWNLVQVEPEPVAVDVNGHDDAIGNGPMVEPVLGNVHGAPRAIGTATTRPGNHSGRSSPGRSSSRESRASGAAGSPGPLPRPSSSGRSAWRKKERQSRSARDAGPHEAREGRRRSRRSPRTWQHSDQTPNQKEKNHGTHIRIRRPRVPRPGPPDERRAGQGHARRLLRGDSQRLGEGEQAGRRHGPRVPAAGGHQGRPHPSLGTEEGIRWTTGHLPVCWRRRRRQASASSSSRRSSHGPTAPSTWTPRPPGRVRWNLPAPRPKTTRRPRAALRRRCDGKLRPRRG